MFKVPQSSVNLKENSGAFSLLRNENKNSMLNNNNGRLNVNAQRNMKMHDKENNENAYQSPAAKNR